jgi:hypothetical protein
MGHRRRRSQLGVDPCRGESVVVARGPGRRMILRWDPIPRGSAGTDRKSRSSPSLALCRLTPAPDAACSPRRPLRSSAPPIHPRIRTSSGRPARRRRGGRRRLRRHPRRHRPRSRDAHPGAAGSGSVTEPAVLTPVPGADVDLLGDPHDPDRKPPAQSPVAAGTGDLELAGDFDRVELVGSPVGRHEKVPSRRRRSAHLAQASRPTSVRFAERLRSRPREPGAERPARPLRLADQELGRRGVLRSGRVSSP